MIKSYVIYKNPSDYPDKYVVRAFFGEKPDMTPIAVVDTLEEARGRVPSECVNFGREQNDDAVIVECWL